MTRFAFDRLDTFQRSAFHDTNYYNYYVTAGGTLITTWSKTRSRTACSGVGPGGALNSEANEPAGKQA